jgi:hypothetical protein
LNDDQTNLTPADAGHQIMVPLTPSLKEILEAQAKAEGKTPAQILIAAFLRTYNPRSTDDR